MNVLEYIARWHVVIIHFPIALLITAAIVELVLILRRRDMARFTVLLTAIAAGAAVAASALGWMLAGYNPHSDAEDTLALHRWGGIAISFVVVAAAVMGAGALRGRGRGLQVAYRVLVLVGAIGIGTVAHWGGELIYGPGYFWPEREAVEEIKG